MDISALRVKLFCRLLQKHMTGQVFAKPRYRMVIEEELALKGFNEAKISEATWNAWWHGRCKPNITMRAAINAVTNNLASKWLEPCLVNNRLACHLSCLELGVSRSDSTRQEAQVILQTIHSDWFVDRSGVVSTQNNESRRRYTPQGKLSELGISLDKGEETELTQIVNKPVIKCYDPLNPSSIVHFLLSLGVSNLKHNNLIPTLLTNLGLIDSTQEPGLHEAIAVDLASSICAGNYILMSDYRYIKNRGRTGQLIVELFGFWFDDEDAKDDSYHNDNPSQVADHHSLSNTIDKGELIKAPILQEPDEHHQIGTNLESVLTCKAELACLIKLRGSYRTLMCDSGLAVSEINKQAKTFNTGLKL